MSFVEFHDCPQVVPPYVFPDMTLHMCGLGADVKALQAWCDDALNIVPEHRFEPLFPLVLLVVSHYPRMYLEGREALGYSEQAEYSVMFPVVRFDSYFGWMIPADVTWATPFIGVDLPTSALAGQLVLGYPKLSGTITAATATDGSYRASVEMPGMLRTAADPKDDKQQLLTIIEVQTGAPDTTTAAGSSFPSKVLKAFDHPDFGVLTLLEELDPDLFSLTILKQIRDPTDPPEPAYQALLRAEWQQSHIRDFVQYDGATVSITDNETVRIAEMLGLTGGGSAKTKVFEALFATSARCNLRFGDVTTIVQTA